MFYYPLYSFIDARWKYCSMICNKSNCFQIYLFILCHSSIVDNILLFHNTFRLDWINWFNQTNSSKKILLDIQDEFIPLYLSNSKILI